MGLNLNVFSGDPEKFSGLKVDDTDLFLLSGSSCDFWPEVHASIGRIAWAAFESEKSVGDILRRLQRFSELGLLLPRIDSSKFDELMIADDDLILLSENYDNYNIIHPSDVLWIDQEVSEMHIINAAKKINTPVEDILKRLQKFAPLGLKIPNMLKSN